MYKGKIVFATNNLNKLEEARQILPKEILLVSLQEITDVNDLPETHETLEENALEKAEFVSARFGVNCFAEDTGLEVDFLGGAPGVYSARFAGEEKSAAKNIELLLKKMEHAENRKARFRAVIALVLDGKKYFFEGIAEGNILRAPSGRGGFGYDPVFAASGETRSFAEMAPEEKNRISHRRKALDALAQFLDAY